MPPPISFLHEDEFAKRMPKKGLITKREVRLLSLAAMHIRPDSVVWDIGAGSGSVAIEAAMLPREGRVYAIEVDPEGVAICLENVRQHRVDNVRVIAGRAPEVLGDLETPDAVFVGGSKGSTEEILSAVIDRLPAGGHVVANAITLENASEIYATLRQHGIIPEVTLLQVSRAQPLARYLRYEVLNLIQIFAAMNRSRKAPDELWNALWRRRWTRCLGSNDATCSQGPATRRCYYPPAQLSLWLLDSVEDYPSRRA